MTSSHSPHAMTEQAMALQQAGRFAEAAAAYERLLAEWPDLPTSWYNLGFCLRMAGRFGEALAAYGEALKRGVGRPEEVHLNRAVIHADHLRRDEEAERELHAALTINPRYVPALLNLANLHEDRGNRDAARDLYENALAVDPSCSLALARFALLRGASDPDDPLIGRLRQSIARPGLPASDKADLGFALGGLLDSCGAYDAAFAAYSAANRHSRESAGGTAKPYDRKRHEAFVGEIIRTFTADRFAPRAPVPGEPPIFICGMFRSGSTLAEQILAAHPGVTAGGELDLLPALVRGELAPFPAAVAKASEATIERLAAQYLDGLKALFPGGDRITDKRVDNFLAIGLIKRLFPNARIVHTTRDPLDNCLSVFFQHLGPLASYKLDLMDTGHYYRQYRRLMDHWRSLFGPDILDFDYDDAVRGPEPAIRRLLDYCGLPWDEACLHFYRAPGTVKTASVWQVRQPLYQRSSGRWRHYERHLGRLKAYLADLA